MNQAPDPWPMLKNFDVFKVQNNSGYKGSNITSRVKMTEKSQKKFESLHAKVRIIIILSFSLTSSLHYGFFFLFSHVAGGLHFND